MPLLRFAACNLIPSLLAGAIAWWFVRIAVRVLRVRDARRRLALYGIPLLKSALVLLGLAPILPWPAFLSRWQAAAVPWDTAIPCALVWAGCALILRDALRRRVYERAQLGAVPATVADARVVEIFRRAVRAYDGQGKKASLEFAGVDILLTDQITVPAILTETDEKSILLPDSLVDRLSDDELQGVISHELAHLVISRPAFASPSWWALLTPLSPIAFFVSRDIEMEEELACDAVAARHSDNPAGYAEALVKVYRFARSRSGGASGAPAGLLPQLTGGRPAITERVEALLRDRSFADARWLQACASYAAWGAALALLF